MPSRRYYIAIAPVAHINGKMAPQWQKCPNTEDPEHTRAEGFWYGYKRRSNPDVSRFGVRVLCRDLTQHPYTPAETENRILFTASLQAVYEHKIIAGDWALCMEDFAAQDEYKTPIGFAVAICRAGGGVWPDGWRS